MSSEERQAKQSAPLGARGIQNLLSELEGWSISQGSLVRELNFASASDAANRVSVFSKQAARLNHPLDLSINGAHVVVRLPPAQGQMLSRADFKFAKVIAAKTNMPDAESDETESDETASDE